MSSTDEQQAICPKCKMPVDQTAIACEACGHVLVALNSKDVIGKSIGNLEIVSKIARGGMGTVYRGEHRTLRTPYAVKILHARFSTDPTTAERFRREAITCSQLRHPNVVFVTDFGFHDEMGLYIIMEFVEGDSLARLLKKNQHRLSLARASLIMEQACDALQAAHDLGIVHRDLKPDNIMVISDDKRGDFVKVLDFGIAQIQKGGPEEEDGPQLTRAGLVLGTPAYIAPEQINGEAQKVGPEADIYAMGTILYEMITGHPPFHEGSDFEILSKHMFQQPALVSESRQDLKGTRVEALVARMLAKKPEERPSSMTELRQLLGEAMAELREKGVHDAVYRLPSGELQAIRVDTGAHTMTPAPVRLTNLIQHITTHTPQAPVAQFLTTLPSVVSLQEEIFHLSLWGILQRDLLDPEVGEERFQHAVEHMHLVLEAVLNMKGDDHRAIEALLRSLRDVFRLITEDRPREEAMVKALQPLSQHHLFPMDVLPEWAQPQSTGSTWQAFKNIMTTDLRVFGKRSKPSPAPAPEKKPEPPPVEAKPAQEPPGEERRSRNTTGARRRPRGLVEKNSAPSPRRGWKPGSTYEPDASQDERSRRRSRPAPQGLMGQPNYTPLHNDPSHNTGSYQAPRPTGGYAVMQSGQAPQHPTGQHTHYPTGQHAYPQQPQHPTGQYAAPVHPTGQHAYPQQPQHPTGQYAAPVHPTGQPVYTQPQPTGQYVYPQQPQHPTGQHIYPQQPQHPTGQYAAPQHPTGQHVYPQQAQHAGPYAAPQGYAPAAQPPAAPYAGAPQAYPGQPQSGPVIPGAPGSPIQPVAQQPAPPQQPPQQHPWAPQPQAPQHGYVPPQAAPQAAPQARRGLPPEAGSDNAMSRAMAAFRRQSTPPAHTAQPGLAQPSGPVIPGAPGSPIQPVAQPQAPTPPPQGQDAAPAGLPPANQGAGARRRVQRQGPRIYGQKKDS